MCKYIIVGKSASGKDWCQNLMVDRGFKPLRSYTSRPVRPNERGDEYIFTTRRKMERMKEAGKFISFRTFNDWHYGFTMDDFLECDVAVLSIGGLADIRTWNPDILKFVTIIYLDIPAAVRMRRLKERYCGGNVDDTIERRMSADEHDFANFNYFDVRFTDNDTATEFINKSTPESTGEKKKKTTRPKGTKQI